MEQFDDELWSFIRDDRFVRWVLQPSAEDVQHWEAWMATHPEHSSTIERAANVVKELHHAQTPAYSNAGLEKFYQGIDQHIQGISKPAPVIKTYTRSRMGWKLGIAAAVLMFAGIASLMIYRSEKPATQGLQTDLAASTLTRLNTTGENQTAYLVDGSSVILQAGASIEHPLFLQKDKREVHLKGNAFFEVAKDSTRPFYVYTPHLAIRVLGTSFHVRTAANGNMEVIVRTGKVSVFSLDNLQKPLYILKPNQRVRYDLGKDQFKEDSITTDAAAITGKPAAMAANFNFDDAPVMKILQAMQAAYGIKINADEKTFSHCVITTSLQAETFEDKLRIICSAINASYKIEQGQVFIDGKPCS